MRCTSRHDEFIYIYIYICIYVHRTIHDAGVAVPDIYVLQ